MIYALTRHVIFHVPDSELEGGKIERLASIIDRQMSYFGQLDSVNALIGEHLDVILSLSTASSSAVDIFVPTHPSRLREWMDSPVVGHVFRQLFATPARRCLHAYSRTRPDAVGRRRGHHARPAQRRSYAIRHREDDGHGRSNWQQRLDAFPRDISQDVKEAPRVTSEELRHRVNRPRRVKMYTRDFIEDSLYNLSYGYFSKHATIFTPGRPFDFNSMADAAEFNKQVDRAYVEFEDDLDEFYPDDTRQLWHTPTELFQPHYGEAIARYLVTNYKMTLYPYADLIIYEIGAGNGTLMRNILDWIRDNEPSVYARTQYRVIEISSSLLSLQKTALTTSRADPWHLEHVQLINRNILDWSVPVQEPCFFLALEVIDNFGHDAIRYDPFTEEPLQGSVLIDREGEFYEFYEADLDPLASQYLRLRQLCARQTYHTPLTWPPAPIRRLRHSLPFAANLTLPEYIPVRLMQFFQILSTYFPHHRLLLADFHYLPQATKGINAPVVQTRYKRRVIPVRTPYNHQGYFDIFFPTNFQLMEDMYRALTGKLTRVQGQREWLQGWGDSNGTIARNGEDIMAQWYANASVLTTV
ncbi:hypothetical protein DV737_g5681, partial [Chaetothyriales sp. CBS 132003]